MIYLALSRIVASSRHRALVSGPDHHILDPSSSVCGAPSGSQDRAADRDRVPGSGIGARAEGDPCGFPFVPCS